MRRYFYNETVKRLIVIFGSVFNGLQYKDDKGMLRSIPMFYTQREKFIIMKMEAADLKRFNVTHPMPRMGFELMGMSFNPEVMTNVTNKVRERAGSGTWQYNRIPWEFNFNLYLMTKQFEEGLQVVEQILPIFNPTFNVTVDELDKFELQTDVGITLDSVSHDIDYGAGNGFDEQRSIIWTLAFSVKGFIYGDTKNTEVIKETITNLGVSDYNKLYESFISTVSPRTSNKTDPHIIIDKVVDHE